MKSFDFATRGGNSPQGKPRVFFTAHPDDHSRYLKVVSEEILDKQNCVVFYMTDTIRRDEFDDYRFQLEQMQLFAVPVTKKLLTSPSRTMDVDVPFAISHHIPVLPLMQESGLDELFSEIFGDLQYLDKNRIDPTAISFDEKLTKFLDAVIVGDELAAEIRAAFDAYCFLSYRKKDRKHAQELMRLIHADPLCRDIAIWYDEFLTPGEDFNAAIEAQLRKSDLFAMAVTPNLINEDNYILSVEYPKAVAFKKKILPVEMVQTKRFQLKHKYKNIPDPVKAEDTDKMHDLLLSQLNRAAHSLNDSPDHTFFIALAYLNGIDVEVDLPRGAKLMEASANGGCIPAISKMVDMYNNGKGVGLDYHRAVEWQEKLCEALE